MNIERHDLLREICELKAGLAASQARVGEMEAELGRAYRALRGFYGKIAKGEVADRAMVAYHSPSLAAAMRFVTEGALDGSAYFEGKHFEVMHGYLRQYHAALQSKEVA